ncbi:MAG: DUF881 domain-containing protein [Bacillota bacterium]|nr:DUF881 domain-containing protein [Bacillota bacterium]
MKLNEMKIFVFLGSMIVGIMVAMNLSFGLPSQAKVLNTTQYQVALIERSKLYNDITLLENQYKKEISELAQYNASNPSQEKIIDNMKSELSQNRRLLGLDEVKGKGAVITLNDASTNFSGTVEDDDILQWSRIVHNTDVLKLVNDLRATGAEALSINGQRIMSITEIYCWGPFLRINKVNIGAPFYISFIGNSNNIGKYLNSDEGYLTFLKYRGISINYDEKESVIIPAYIGSPKTQFMKEVKNN